MIKEHFLKYFVFKNEDYSYEWGGVLYRPHPDELWKATKTDLRSPFYAHCPEFNRFKAARGTLTHEEKLTWYDLKLPTCKPNGFMKDLPRITLLDEQDWAAVNAAKTKPVMHEEMTLTQIAALYEKRAVKPFDVADLRRKTFDLVNENMDQVGKVLTGETKWNNVQVRLFATLLDRVLPKMPTSYVNTHEAPKAGRSLNDLSREELEQIALTGRIPETVDASPLASFVEKAEDTIIGQKISDLDADISAAQYLASQNMIEKKAAEIFVKELEKEKAELKKKPITTSTDE